MTSQEAVSGAAAIVNLSRRTITTIPMSLEDAKELGVMPSMRRRYFRLVTTKTNMAPLTDDTPWYELKSITLPNPEPPLYKHGDNVQAVVRVQFNPAANVQLTVDDKIIRKAILDVVQRGKMMDGEAHPYSPNVTGAKNQRSIKDDAMDAVKRVTASRQWVKSDLEAVVTRALNRMMVDGWLVDEEIQHGRFRRRRGLRVDWPNTPWPNKERGGSDGAAHNQEMACGASADEGVAVNWSMDWSMIGQLPKQVVVVNCPPLGGH